jgi:alkyldihydroxyacetonephosphate synthase
MRRWNGWGDDTVDPALPPGGLRFIAERVGSGTPSRDADLARALAAVPASRLSDLAGADTAPEARLRHARGQSFPDWLAMRHGRMGPFPDAVATPRSHQEAADLLRRAIAAGAAVIPYGGGTSVVGHLNAEAGDRPVLSIDLGLMSRLLELDQRSRLARFGAGAPGPHLEAQLRAHGYLLGHYPQSFQYSTVGGWVAARSSGQQSLRYGRIEQLFAGGRLATPIGELTLPTMPASSAGPDLRELVLGSEGRLGMLTEAVVRVRPVPERDAFHAVFFGDWDTAAEAVREIVQGVAQARSPLSMLRLSNVRETATQLELAGHPRLIGALRRYLRLRGVGDAPCMLLIGVTGDAREYRYGRAAALAIARTHGGVHTGRAIGKGWAKSRFAGPYLRNALWEAGYGVDTAETAVDWPRVTAAMRAMEDAATGALEAADERVHAFTHLSHVYPQGSSIYSTFVFRVTGDHDRDLERWRRLKTAVSEAVVAVGGTISHQHGVGVDHKPYLAAEKGEAGLAALRAAFAHFDPQGLMNPGKLLDDV